MQNVMVDDVTRSWQWERVESRTAVTIRVEVEASGDGLADQGMRSVRYAVALGDGRTLLAATHDRSGSYERNQEILDRMMASLTFE